MSVIKHSRDMIWRVPIAFLLVEFALMVVINLSPIYDFQQPRPFAGEKVYNPYSQLDTLLGWKRANLHTHTHATRWINECELYADSVLAFYDKYNYDVVGFSNHMELTKYPGEEDRQIWEYEHGYNFFKFHNLVFNPKHVVYWDILFPVLCSQKQFKIDVLASSSDFVVFNHPDRTSFTNDEDMKYVTNYRLIEHDCGFNLSDTYGEKWDVALSSGHYVPSIINDDLHKPRLTHKIARRCSFINSKSCNYSDVKQALLSGNFFTMHLPDFGNGDETQKIAANRELPMIKNIGMTGDTVFVELTQEADSVAVIGQGGKRIVTATHRSQLAYKFKETDTYVRLEARFASGVVIFSNPFARYTGTEPSGTPYVEFAHPVNWWLTLLFNFALLLIFVTFIILAYCIVTKQKITLKRGELS